VKEPLPTGRLYTLAPRDRTGFLGLGGRQVLVLGGAVVVGVVAASRTATVALGIWPLLGAALVSFLRVGGVPVVDALGPGVVHGLRALRGRTRWTAPPARRQEEAPAGSGRPLPPPLDGHRVLAVDGARYHPGAAGSTVAVTHDPLRRTYAATLRATGVGGAPFALTEASEQEHLLDRWGDALAAFCQERCPVVWVRWAESSIPADGQHPLPGFDVDGGGDPSDPAVASYRAVLETAGALVCHHEVLVTVAVGAQRVPAGRRARGEGAGGRPSREAACVDALLAQLRLFAERLEAAGLLVSGPLTPDELDEALAARMSGLPDGGPRSLASQLRAWHQVAPRDRTTPARWAPATAQATWGSWVVDGVHHRAFHVAEWPRLDLRAAWMAPLLVWGGGRRTVAVLLEPVPLRTSQRAIERQATKLASERAHRESKGFRVPAHHRRAARAVEEREEELVAGFAELSYAGLVWVSAPTAAELERHSAELAQLAAGCGVALEPVAGRHDLGVAACLPTAVGLARAWVA
jgi:hypothetical protein